jgi:hypothetical protein
VDQERLTELLGFGDQEEMRGAHEVVVQDTVEKGELQREPIWTEGIAVGQSEFLKSFQKVIRSANPGRRILETADGCQLREDQATYSPLYWGENGEISTK